MAEPLENLARLLENDPFFLGCPLRLFARSENLTDDQLAERLGCVVETLISLRLCRAPAVATENFQKDIERVAATFQVDAGVLAEAVQRGEVIWNMAQGPNRNTLMAARDGEKPQGGGK